LYDVHNKQWTSVLEWIRQKYDTDTRPYDIAMQCPVIRGFRWLLTLSLYFYRQYLEVSMYSLVTYQGAFSVFHWNRRSISKLLAVPHSWGNLYTKYLQTTMEVSLSIESTSISIPRPCDNFQRSLFSTNWVIIYLFMAAE
jgi:hypothetical protein